MFKIPCDRQAEFRNAFKYHKMNIASSNVLYHTMAMLNRRHTIIDRDLYQEMFQSPLNDIELTTTPIEAFMPIINNDNKKIFKINRNVDEYKKIAERATIDWIKSTIGSGHNLICTLMAEPQKLEVIHDDLFIYYNFFKYLDQIDIIRVDNFSNYTKIIEYVVENISLNDWKDYIKTDRINEEKYAKKCEDLIFNPDIVSIQKFYMNNENPNIPKFDVVKLIMKLTSNQVIKDDMILILAVYLIISFAMSDFNNQKVEQSPCAKYVQDVLCKL